MLGAAEVSCISCRRLKRRCSKDLPVCSLCNRVGRECKYPPAIRRSTITRNTQLQSPTTTVSGTLSPRLQRDTADVVTSTSASGPTRTVSHVSQYLDSMATRGQKCILAFSNDWIECTTVLPPLSVARAVEIAQQHLETTHEWLPIISIKKMQKRLQQGTALNADETALLYMMDILMDLQDQALIYQVVRDVVRLCEDNGHLSVHLLATQILLAFYEIGHGFYPTAYLTVAHCSRLCHILGLHDKRKATQLLAKQNTWVEVEERRRLWWAVLILDRYVHVGFRFRALSTPTIPPDEIIPANDEKWTNGEMAVNPLLVMSMEASAWVSPYARICQAAHLLGRACQHVNELPSEEDPNLHFQEAFQIVRVTKALLTVIQAEADTQKRHKLFTSKALCYSTLLLIYDVHSCVEVEEIETYGGNKGLRMDLQQLAIDGYKEVSPLVITLARDLLTHAQQQTASIGDFNPLILHCLYSTAGVYAWWYRETEKQEDLQGFRGLVQALTELAERWPVAGVYAKMLAGTEVEISGSCYQ